MDGALPLAQQFDFEVNRSERAVQARWLVPLLDRPEGRLWLMKRLGADSSAAEAVAAQSFHFVFPLGDLFTLDFHRCAAAPSLHDAFIRRYNDVFNLAGDPGVDALWHASSSGGLRSPTARGRSGWYDELVEAKVASSDMRDRINRMVRLLGTEADAMVITPQRIVLAECKYNDRPDKEQYLRWRGMAEVLGRRLDRQAHCGMVLQTSLQPDEGWVDVPVVLWTEIKAISAELT